MIIKTKFINGNFKILGDVDLSTLNESMREDLMSVGWSDIDEFKSNGFFNTIRYINSDIYLNVELGGGRFKSRKEIIRNNIIQYIREIEINELLSKT